MVIEWISKIWSNFSRDILRNSFIKFGLVTSDLRYHNQLQHFVKTRILIDDIEPAEEQNLEFRVFERVALEELKKGQDEVFEQDEYGLIKSDEE